MGAVSRRGMAGSFTGVFVLSNGSTAGGSGTHRSSCPCSRRNTLPDMARPLDYLAYIRSESARFGACLAAADPAARVPSCPDWNAVDLLWHLAEVQLFWGTIVRDRLTDPGAAESAQPDQPDDIVALLSLFERATA